MDFEGERFAEFSRTQGKLRLEMEGTAEEKEYTAVNFINPAGTVGYSEVTADGKPDCIFVSRTAGGIVLTMPGEQNGPAPFPVEGYRTLTTVASGSPANSYYDAHMQALGEELPIADRSWLEKEVPLLGQRALDVTMKIFAQVCEQMDAMMSGLGNAMGEMVEGMGKAMGEAMEGIGKAVGEALGGAPEEAAPKPGKAKVAPPEIATRPKAPAKIAKPARKAVAPGKRPKPATKAAAPGKKAKPARKAPAPKRKAKPVRRAAAPKKKQKPARKAASPKKKARPARKAKAPAKRPKGRGGAKKRK